MESHNHPSFIEPYQGAATGVGGILPRRLHDGRAADRAALDSLRFGRPDHPRTASPRPRRGRRHRRLRQRRSACPPSAARSRFDPSYDGNILVNAFPWASRAGPHLLRARQRASATRSSTSAPRPAATASTARPWRRTSSTRSSEAKRPTVQVGDPFMEKLLLEACLELMARPRARGRHPGHGRRRAHLARRSRWPARAGTGIELDLDRVPRRADAHDALRDPALRVAGAHAARGQARPRGGGAGDLPAVGPRRGGHRRGASPTAACQLRAPPARAGSRRRSPTCRSAPLAEGLRRCERPRAQPARRTRDPGSLSSVALPTLHRGELRRPCCSSSRHPRHRLQGVGLAPVRSQVRAAPWSARAGDAAVVRVSVDGRPRSPGLAVTVDCNGRFPCLDPYEGAALAVAESSRNLVASAPSRSASPTASTSATRSGPRSCGSSPRPSTAWPTRRGARDADRVRQRQPLQRDRGTEHPAHADHRHGRPAAATGGAGAFRLPAPGERGSSVGPPGAGRQRVRLRGPGAPHRPAPQLDWRLAGRCRRCARGRPTGLASSAHDFSDGGLAVALAECCLGDLAAGAAGLRPTRARLSLDLAEGPALPLQALLFGEAPSRVVVSFLPEHQGPLAALCAAHGAPLFHLGVTVEEERLVLGSPSGRPVPRAESAAGHAARALRHRLRDVDLPALAHPAVTEGA